MIENQLTTIKKYDFFRHRQAGILAASELRNNDPEDHFRIEQRRRQLMYYVPIAPLRYEFPYVKFEYCQYEHPFQVQRD
jgi:hypothetical protein